MRPIAESCRRIVPGGDTTDEPCNHGVGSEGCGSWSACQGGSCHPMLPDGVDRSRAGALAHHTVDDIAACLEDLGDTLNAMAIALQEIACVVGALAPSDADDQPVPSRVCLARRQHHAAHRGPAEDVGDSDLLQRQEWGSPCTRQHCLGCE